jgi:hypothetical protein
MDKNKSNSKGLPEFRPKPRSVTAQSKKTDEEMLADWNALQKKISELADAQTLRTPPKVEGQKPKPKPTPPPDRQRANNKADIGSAYNRYQEMLESVKNPPKEWVDKANPQMGIKKSNAEKLADVSNVIQREKPYVSDKLEKDDKREIKKDKQSERLTRAQKALQGFSGQFK